MSMLSEIESELQPAILIQVFNPNLVNYDLDETEGMAETAGYSIFFYLTQNLTRLNAKTYLGKGKVSQIRETIQTHFNHASSNIWKEMELYEEYSDERLLESIPTLNIEFPEKISKPKDLTIIFNNRISNSQRLTLQGIWGCKVIDRDDLVLEIFEKNAQTKESKLQIELVKMALETDIVKRELGQHLEEKQGRGFMGKGLSGWEPRLKAYRNRKKKIEKELDNISKQRDLRRKSRTDFYNVGILGYTNAGKSTLLNQLANTNLETANQEFTTVSTRARKVIFPKYDKYGNWCGEKVIFTDSVGFISDMSPILIEAFLSTLEELNFSDLLVLVVDISEKDISRILLKIRTSFDIIRKIGAIKIPRILLANKIDKIGNEKAIARISKINRYFPNLEILKISAKKKLGFKAFQRLVLKHKHQKYPPKKPDWQKFCAS